ncbi:probable caffeine synthase MTL2 [Humulus lupulus]|uniref:probable caffeine synthase MTL2 n=1 Tax=Humulus lupulus TaxID=3486 RepID=UPI002B40F5B7|nr:probable caffeine synthase MTL2 [Humulus lupulus]XP_062079440.1 probable caffeine synthase MTL2 [Humulus lupulus]XP_062102073.1 probable caffeine synthase MTL2 [Humulus lupulus]XP_062102074.1 probable caffeine synthase MTL2 [Humulus lupulus]
MEEKQVLHMKGGVGKESYAENSSLQKMVISKVKATVEESALEAYCNIFPDCMRIADLGCSSGPNSLAVTSYILDEIINQMTMKKKKPLTFQVFLNDLPGNDFNTVFQSLSSFYERLKKKKKNETGGKFDRPLCFVMAMPGSFYERLFPNNFIHFFHSSYSLHWLSKTPKGLVSETGEAHNKGNIYITKASPDVVGKAYLSQFQENFTTFLRYRSEEIVTGGCMVLTMMGSATSNDPKHKMEIMGRALNDMVSQGIVEEKSLDNFNMPVYCPTAKEVRMVIEDEGSFELQKLEVFEIAWDAGFNEEKGKINNSTNVDEDNIDKYNRGKYVSDYMRAVLEPILMKQFGECIMDDLFERFTHKIIESMANENWHYINLAISLTKKQGYI